MNPKQKIKHLVGSFGAATINRVLAARWFPLFRTFHLRRNWLYDVCRFAGTRDLKVLFDVGANVGNVTKEMGRFFPCAQIHSFEPVAATFDQLEANTTGYLNNVRIHRLALGGEAAKVRIALHPHSELNSLRVLPEAAPDFYADRSETIEVVRLDAFCATQGIKAIDLLKTDTEGFDAKVLAGAAGFLKKSPIPFIYSEVGFAPGDSTHTQFQDLLNILSPYGYTLKGFYEQWAENQSSEMFCNALFVHPLEISRRFPTRRLSPTTS